MLPSERTYGTQEAHRLKDARAWMAKIAALRLCKGPGWPGFEFCDMVFKGLFPIANFKTSSSCGATIMHNRTIAKLRRKAAVPDSASRPNVAKSQSRPGSLRPPGTARFSAGHPRGKISLNAKGGEAV